MSAKGTLITSEVCLWSARGLRWWETHTRTRSEQNRLCVWISSAYLEASRTPRNHSNKRRVTCCLCYSWLNLKFGGWNESSVCLHDSSAFVCIWKYLERERNFKCRTRARRVGVFSLAWPFLTEMDKQVWFPHSESLSGSLYGPIICASWKSSWFFSANSIRPRQNAELLTQATGQSLRCNCSRSNRLNKLVIHTPTTACGCQREEKKILSL